MLLFSVHGLDSAISCSTTQQGTLLQVAPCKYISAELSKVTIVVAGLVYELRLAITCSTTRLGYVASTKYVSLKPSKVTIDTRPIVVVVLVYELDLATTSPALRHD